MNAAPPVIALRPDQHRPHLIHTGERIWPGTNCYIDAWAEMLRRQPHAPSGRIRCLSSDVTVLITPNDLPRDEGPSV
ncbi:DUF1839 family protein [Rhodococcus sp. O3]|uniref:DUF1839 family protein n=1 Tax=Rhodococcus sp. O3 TaxID=3404919 RepID=UPI003B67FE33